MYKIGKKKFQKKNKSFVENNILNAKLIALHYLKMQGPVIFTDLCVGIVSRGCVYALEILN